MMTPELYVFLFAALGAYVTVTVWQRTAEERRVQQLAQAEKERQTKATAHPPGSARSIKGPSR